MGFPLLDVLNIGSKIIDRVIPDKAQQEAAKLELLKLQQSGELEEMKAEMSAILAEAQSADKWTSRARPSFLYCMYIIILAAIPMGIVSAISPATGTAVASGFQSWLAAIPSDMWWLMATGYLGYSTNRTVEKFKGASK